MITELLPQGSRVLCAVSGGADSMALLHRLWSARESLGIAVCAAHYEHGLRGEESRRDADFVARWCREREIPCLVEHGDVPAYAGEKQLGIEEAARELRYAFLERAAAELNCDLIATAHTADDNAETLLFHLLRGSGAAGLGGIPRQRGRIIRPLLDTSRAEIEDYLRQNAVPHVEDSSNENEIYSRNLLRRRVMPVLRQLNPRCEEAMGRTARLLERDEDCLSGQAAAFLASQRPDSLDGAALTALHPAIASRVLRLWWPAALSFEQSQAVLAFAAGTERAALDLPGGLLRREQGRLYRGEETRVCLPERELPREGSLELPEAGLSLCCELLEQAEEINGLFKTYLFKYEKICGKMTCTGRREGDRFHPAGRGCGKTLKALFTEAGLTREQRDCTPVLRDEAGILAVLGFGVDERVRARPGDRVLRVSWKNTFESTK